MKAKQTPLIELLERVPQDARVVVEHDQFSSSAHPVGRLCHEAATELRRLHAETERLKAERDALLNLFKEQCSDAEWQEKAIYFLDGSKPVQNWLFHIYVPVPLDEKDKSPEAAVDRILADAIAKVEGKK